MPIETTNSGLPPAPPRGDVDHLRQHPAFQEGRLRLAEALRRAWDLAKQAALTAPQQELSRQLESQTGDLRLPATLQRKGVQQHFGNRSEKLAAAFGRITRRDDFETPR